ncbi:uncharacterized protein A4U43_C07F21180 [Asparagus officinalis]|uniref:Uncharacterized protein n=1 Tax=Asparagus officinalis TaxID=4686 RepID=A0A5P1EIV8_ASPOF|nr:uncharacterized protein LOC109850479 [Asparagus officinalis]ONK64010.1 uncharacterized protein A4U43_C07F21180 [Asparagus officinalis]
MDKKRKKGGKIMNTQAIRGATLREENTGKKRVDVSSMLRMEHLQRLSTWAGVEAGIPPLGALFGHRLAANAEAEGVPLDPSTFVCRRCESILQPGSNCTVRIEKSKKKKHRKKAQVPSQNNVVYKCHFCSHPNLMRGTQKGYIKSLLPSKPKSETNSTKTRNSSERELGNKEKTDQNVKVPLTIGKCECPREVSVEMSPLTPLEMLANSSKKKRKRNLSASNKDSSTKSTPVTSNCGEGTTVSSSKRKRKGWTSLKKIAESNEAKNSQSISNFAIPFLLQMAK